MCGITGVINFNRSESLEAHSLLSMTGEIKHRGPDDEGYLLVNNRGCFHFSGDDTPAKNGTSGLPKYYPANGIQNARDCPSFVALGHRRLSILDLSVSGHQPMSYADRYWIVYNGEIYNYLEIRDELINEGYQFYSQTDTEVVMAAYDKWGKECLNKFNGMWAFAIYDRKDEKLFISRDRFGIKPLVYYLDYRKLIFASEIKAILRHEGVKTEPNARYIKKFLKKGACEYSRETAFTDIYRFSPACYVEIDISKINARTFLEKQFWTVEPNLSNEEFDQRKAAEYAQQYYNLLNDSVKLRLRADVNVGSAFSGGLDSSAVVCLINKMLREKGVEEKQETFSTVYKSEGAAYCDESRFIDDLTEQFNIKSHQIEPMAKTVLEEYEKMIYAMDNPQESSLMSYMFTYKLVASSDVKVTIDGQGADELQGGYIRYLVNYFCHLPLKNLKREARRFASVPRAKAQIKLGILFNILRRFSLSWVAEKLLNLFGKYSSPFVPPNQRMYNDMVGNLITLFHYGDRSSMAYSIESRFPFMDYRMVEFWASLPIVYKIQNGWTKYCARLAMDSKLPGTITWRKDKMGWKIPQDYWFRGELKEWFINKIESSIFLKQLRIEVDVRKELNKKYKDHKTIKKLIRLLNLALWYEIFFHRKVDECFSSSRIRPQRVNQNIIMDNQARYVIITPVKDEAKHIEQVLKTVCSQTIRPKRWVIVDDGSKDNTKELVQSYSQKFEWIQVVNTDNIDEKRASGSKVVRAFNKGLEQIENHNYDFLVKLDADLILPDNYFEEVASAFRDNEKIGLCGGFCLNKKNGQLIREKSASYHVRGAFKAYRRKCFIDIGGINEVWGWDGMDEMTAMYRGWETATLDLPVIHLRPTSQAYNAINHAYESGKAAYRMRNDLILTLIRFVTRLTRKPIPVYAFSFIFGYFFAMFAREKRHVDVGLGRFINRFHFNRFTTTIKECF